MTKVCRKCGDDLPLSEFGPYRTQKDGHDYYCRNCRKESRKLRHQKDLDYAKEYRKNNPEKVKALWKNFAEKNKEYLKEKDKRYVRENPHKARAKWAKRRHKIEKSVFAKLYKKEILLVYEKAKNISADIEYHVDHIIPLNHPNVCGLHVPWNLQLLTKSENSSKHNKFDGTYENESWRTNG